MDRAPGRESAVVRAAALAEGLGRTDLALAYWRRAIALSPERAAYRGRVALLLEALQAWDEVGPASLEWVRREPGGVGVRLLRVRCLLHEGDRAGAEAEFAKVRALRPADLDRLEAWYAELLH